MNIHGLSGFRTRDPNDEAAADQRLRPHGQRGRPVVKCSNYGSYESTGVTNIVAPIWRRGLTSTKSYPEWLYSRSNKTSNQELFLG